MATHYASAYYDIITFKDPDGYMNATLSGTSNDGSWDYSIKNTITVKLAGTVWDRRIEAEMSIDKENKMTRWSGNKTIKDGNKKYGPKTTTMLSGSNGSLEPYCWGKKGGDIVYIPTKLHYICKYQAAWLGPYITSSNVTYTFSPGTPVVVPYMPVSGGGFSGSPLATARKPASFTFTASWSGVNLSTQRQMTIYLQRSVNGGGWVTIATTTSSSSSGSIRAYQSAAASVGTDHWHYRLHIEYEGGSRDVDLGTKTLLEPLPAPPTMGYVNNTTPRSINTTQGKVISANWGVSYTGWPPSTITYEWHAYSSVYGEIASGSTTANSHSFTWNVPAKDVRNNIYWSVRAKNSTGWSGYMSSGNSEVYWAYVEPSLMSSASVSPNRFQLFNGSTNISFTPKVTINGWGDRPGNRNVEFALLRSGSINKYYGKNVTNSTGVLSQNCTATIPETDLNTTYSVMAYKRLNDTEYSTGSDPRYPNKGQNHTSCGNITFYEVIGRVTGSFELSPTNIIAGMSNDIKYTVTYDQQSSEKVALYLEVYKLADRAVTKRVDLDTLTKSQTINKTITSILVAPQQADIYEIRLKAVVTELLGNTHEYTLATLTPDCSNPPIGELSLNKLSKPLPSDNILSSLAKQDTDITYNYVYQCVGVKVTRVVLVTKSQPFGTEQVEVPCDPSATSYRNTCTKLSQGEYTTNSTVSSYLLIYYQINGSTTTYSFRTNTVETHITPTRYLFTLTQVSTGEKQMNKLHPLVGSRDTTSYKIHVD